MGESIIVSIPRIRSLLQLNTYLTASYYPKLKLKAILFTYVKKKPTVYLRRHFYGTKFLDSGFPFCII